MNHFRRWGAIYVLGVMFAGSLAGQFATSFASGDDATKIWAEVLANWQSEWLQLVFQAVLLLALKHQIFKAEAHDLERLEAKIDKIHDRLQPRSSDGPRW